MKYMPILMDTMDTAISEMLNCILVACKNPEIVDVKITDV